VARTDSGRLAGIGKVWVSDQTGNPPRCPCFFHQLLQDRVDTARRDDTPRRVSVCRPSADGGCSQCDLPGTRAGGEERTSVHLSPLLDNFPFVENSLCHFIPHIVLEDLLTIPVTAHPSLARGRHGSAPWHRRSDSTRTTSYHCELRLHVMAPACMSLLLQN